MAKGAYLTPRIKEMLAEIYIENGAIRPTDAHKELLKRMKKEGLDKTFGPDFPSISSVSKLLKEYQDRDKNQPPELKELDMPWSILDIAKYPIPPEILPTVIKIWKMELEKNRALTIREVYWVARLYYVFMEGKPLQQALERLVIYYKPKTQEEEAQLRETLLLESLQNYAFMYSYNEKVLEFTNQQHPEKIEDMWGRWWTDRGLYEYLTGKRDVFKLFPPGYSIELKGTDKTLLYRHIPLSSYGKGLNIKSPEKPKEAQNER